MSEQRQNLEDLRIANESLRVANDARQDAHEAAQRSLETRTQFLLNMSHELRTPLNHVIGFAEMLQDDLEMEGMDDLAADADRISRAAWNLLNVLADILDVSSMDDESREVTLVEIDGFLDELKTDFEGEFERTENRLLVEVEPGIGPWAIEAQRLAKVLGRLLDNANRIRGLTFWNVTTVDAKMSRHGLMLKVRNGRTNL